MRVQTPRPPVGSMSSFLPAGFPFCSPWCTYATDSNDTIDGPVGELRRLPSPEVVLLVTVDVEPDRRAELLKVLEEEAVGTRDKSLDPDNVRIDILRDHKEPNRFLLYEAYTNEAGVAKHKQTKHYRAWSQFKDSGGFVQMSVQRLDPTSLGDWAFQAEPTTRSSIGVVLVVNIVVAPDRVEDFLKVTEGVAQGSRKESGCARYDVLRDKKEPNKIVLYECYDDERSVDQHKETPHFKAWKEFVQTPGAILSKDVVRCGTQDVVGWGFQASAGAN
mmetsp:Transcript_18353/g.52495  ORF Transcript_18353/g.52495 Transcript_18353/m.52495 type:complete len:275 (-) Transcript_18353:507-1331(-)